MTEKKLRNAEKITVQLFEAIEESNMIVAGKSEEQINVEIINLAFEKFGIKKYWHKKIVRCGKNTLSIYPDNPSNLIVQDDDIVFVDYGPTIGGYETDVARTFVIGNNPTKIKLKNDVIKAWYETQEWFHKQTQIKSSELFQYIVEKAKEYGWEYGGEIAGHIVGKFPHEQPIDPKSLELDVHPDNHNDMFLLDSNGNKRNWILEIHFIDKKNEIGGYFEQML